MSATAISFGAETRSPEPGSVRFIDSAHREHASTREASITRVPVQAGAADLSYEAASEPDLLSAAKDGDQRAFVELCRRHSPSLKRRITRIVRNREDADDVLQDTLIRAFSNLLGFRGQCSFRTWITTIATNNSFMLLRKRRNHPETGFELTSAEGKKFEILQVSDPMPDPEQMYGSRQAIHRLSEAVSMLPPGFRLLVERHHRDEVTLVDAANAIGISVAAAKSRLLRARRMLRRTLKRS